MSSRFIQQMMNQKTRPMSVAEKRIIGVQVLPDPNASHSNPVTPSSLSIASPSISERNNNVSSSSIAVPNEDRVLLPGLHRHENSSFLKWKLRHQDFMPNCVKTKKEDDYERFSLVPFWSEFDDIKVRSSAFDIWNIKVESGQVGDLRFLAVDLALFLMHFILIACHMQG